MEDQVRTLSGLNVLAGIWLIAAPFILNYNSSGNFWQEFSLGIAVVIFGLTRLAAPRVAWPGWINALIGLWIIVAPWVISTTTPAAHWNEFITGAIILILGYASAAATENRQHAAHQ